MLKDKFCFCFSSLTFIPIVIAYRKVLVTCNMTFLVLSLKKYLICPTRKYVSFYHMFYTVIVFFKYNYKYFV